MNELLDSVDSLTKRWSHRVVQDATADQPQRITIVRHKPRLHMLADAITTSTNKDGGGALARERNLINTQAVQMLADIRRGINKIAATLDVPAGEPIPTLRAWYVASLAKITTDAWQDEYTAKLHRWATDIDDLLNPPEQVTIEQPCPMCEAAFFYDKADKTEKPWPLRARKWDIRQHGTDKADASCMVCGATWDGLTAIRELAYHLEEIDGRHTGEGVA